MLSSSRRATASSIADAICISLSQAELIEPYLGLREDLVRGAYANYAAGIAGSFHHRRRHQPGARVRAAGTHIAGASPTKPTRSSRCAFMNCALLELVGFMPETGECVRSRADLLPEAQYFSYDEGGVVSRAAAQDDRAGLIALDYESLKLLRHLGRSGGYDRLAQLRLSRRQHAELERILLGYITHVLEIKLQSVAFIRRLRRASAP